MATQKKVTNQFGDFVVIRHDISVQFVCDRCLQPKVTKIVVTWVDKQGKEKTICNGCYGLLSSNQTN
jgi:hypothetical protein